MNCLPPPVLSGVVNVIAKTWPSMYMSEEFKPWVVFHFLLILNCMVEAKEERCCITHPPHVICFQLTISEERQRPTKGQISWIFSLPLFQIQLQLDLKAVLLCSTDVGEIRAHYNTGEHFLFETEFYLLLVGDPLCKIWSSSHWC